jgi:hypothetical protein
LKIANNQIALDSGKCTETKFSDTNYQCLCDSNVKDYDDECTNSSKFKNNKFKIADIFIIEPKNCYDIVPNIKPDEVPFAVFGFALDLGVGYDLGTLDSDAFYAFDETSNQFYTLEWQKVKGDPDRVP